ncbi:hypothetical protein TWF696_004724 [Orbilia brochopaga]|uniref:Uncharacterized protein n=1 Tax=Orbilia brochopaga TaxID=3140254 RepID=A0AAV9UYK5_9PEZI
MMSDPHHSHNPLVKIIEATQDAVGSVFGYHRNCCPHHQHNHHHHPPNPPGSSQPTPVNVNVNVNCCPTGGKPNGGNGNGHSAGGRPVHQTGTSDGSASSGVDDPGAILKIPTRPPTVWPGLRKDLLLPQLWIRANRFDNGTRPIQGSFWECCDIFIRPGIAPQNAPDVPPAKLGDSAKANDDNTLYAHVWNGGKGAAYGVIVEFYWFNPTMGFKEGQQNFIGVAYIPYLAPISQPGSHAPVKCPESWRPTFVNGGHECLVVRVSQPVTDPLGTPPWDASQNRKVGQRNIHVMTASEAAAKPTLGINVGPLFGQPGQVKVDRASTGTMPWLHLVTMDRDKVLDDADADGDVGITPPAQANAGLPNLGAIGNARAAGIIGDAQGVAGDDMKVGFVATDSNPGQGKAHIYRISSTQNGQNVGGYTVVVLGE